MKRNYTVKQVADASGVSVRALRFYDEIGLLKPTRDDSNGYRLYEKEHLLRLQQILFYRELGFELSEIARIIDDPGFDKVAALKVHRERLSSEAKRTETLIQTIDTTLKHLEDKTEMKDDDLYRGFDLKKQSEYESLLIARYGEPARENIEACKRSTKNWKKEDFEKVQKDCDDLHRAFTEAIKKGLKPSSDECLFLVKRHYEVVAQFWKPDRAAYIGLGHLYSEHEDFRKLYDRYHPRLAEYLAQAFEAYATREL